METDWRTVLPLCTSIYGNVADATRLLYDQLMRQEHQICQPCIEGALQELFRYGNLATSMSIGASNFLKGLPQHSNCPHNDTEDVKILTHSGGFEPRSASCRSSPFATPEYDPADIQRPYSTGAVPNAVLMQTEPLDAYRGGYSNFFVGTPNAVSPSECDPQGINRNCSSAVASAAGSYRDIGQNNHQMFQPVQQMPPETYSYSRPLPCQTPAPIGMPHQMDYGNCSASGLSPDNQNWNNNNNNLGFCQPYQSNSFPTSLPQSLPVVSSMSDLTMNRQQSSHNLPPVPSWTQAPVSSGFCQEPLSNPSNVKTVTFSNEPRPKVIPTSRSSLPPKRKMKTERSNPVLADASNLSRRPQAQDVFQNLQHQSHYDDSMTEPSCHLVAKQILKLSLPSRSGNNQSDDCALTAPSAATISNDLLTPFTTSTSKGSQILQTRQPEIASILKTSVSASKASTDISNSSFTLPTSSQSLTLTSPIPGAIDPGQPLANTLSNSDVLNKSASTLSYSGSDTEGSLGDFASPEQLLDHLDLAAFLARKNSLAGSATAGQTTAVSGSTKTLTVRDSLKAERKRKSEAGKENSDKQHKVKSNSKRKDKEEKNKIPNSTAKAKKKF